MDGDPSRVSLGKTVSLRSARASLCLSGRTGLGGAETRRRRRRASAKAEPEGEKREGGNRDLVFNNSPPHAGLAQASGGRAFGYPKQ